MPAEGSRPPLALIANNHEWSARSLDSILTPRGVTVLRTFDGRQVLEEARRTRPDLFLLDADLPEIGGIELCRQLCSEGSVDPTTPVLVTGNAPSTRELRLECLRAGAWDYVAFPIDAEELLLKLSVYLDSRQAAETLRDACLVDPTTGFYSTRGLLRRVQELGADADRHERALACVALAPDPPADRSPSEAAAEGVAAEVLPHLRELLTRHTRSSDTVGRLGPLEFVVLAPDTDASGAMRLAQRLASLAEDATPAQPSAAFALRAGCFAVNNFHAAALDPVELMVRATLALRQLQSDGMEERIRLFQAGSSPS